MIQSLRILSTMILGIKGERKSEEGATAVEYGLLVALIAGGIVAALLLLGPQLLATFQEVVTNLTAANAA